MTAQIMDGTLSARRVRSEVDTAAATMTEGGHPSPGLATLLIGDDPASVVYVRNKRRSCGAAGMRDLHRHLPGDIGQAEVAALLDELAADPAVSGILLPLPVPAHLDAEALLARIPAPKDVDGRDVPRASAGRPSGRCPGPRRAPSLPPASAGAPAQGRQGLRPCTPAGVIRLLQDHDVPLAGTEVTVVGRSVLVGRPMMHLLTDKDATVTLCHSHTKDLAQVCRRAEILVVTAGVPGLIGPAAIRPGATVADVGIHPTGVGLRGDVDFDRAAGIAGRITPVPGCVGPMTIAMLLADTLRAARIQAGLLP